VTDFTGEPVRITTGIADRLLGTSPAISICHHTSLSLDFQYDRGTESKGLSKATDTEVVED
jgi:hypothetical protein